jgi:hypothetical protein
MAKKSKEMSKDETLLETAKKRFSIAQEADSENRALAREDMQFRAGDQWDDEVKRARQMDDRPCLTVNKIPHNIHQITNEQRQNRSAIKVAPFDDNADPETARIIQGLIRSIESNSNADTAYDIAFDSAVTGGRGYFRITTDYCDHMSMEQDIKVKSISDPMAVYLDPSYREPDGSDANWGFLYEEIPKEDFKARYPHAKMSQDTFDWEMVDLQWNDTDSIRVTEYFEKEFIKDTVVVMPDGSTALKSELDDMDSEKLNAMGVSFDYLKLALEDKTLHRKTTVPKVMWYILCSEEVLERTVWPSKYIPIIPVHGEELWIDKKRIFEGIVRHAKDPQRMYNYWATCETEAIALAPKVPWIGVEGQFEGHEHKWDSIHSTNYGYVEYKDVTLADGKAAPPPQRNFGEAGVQAITNARMLSADDLKSTTGIYDASLGNRSQETSGVGIQRRNIQAQTSNFHFMDNLSRSIRHAGQIMNELIPNVYDTERTVRILSPSDEEEIVTINGIFQDSKTKEKREYDLTNGKYDITFSAGPSYASMRQEAVDSILQMSRFSPQIGQYASDLIFKNSDWPGAEEIAERLRKLLPPQLLGEGENEIPPELQAQMEQMNALTEQLTNALEEAQYKLENKVMELESRERIEMAKIQKDLSIEQARLDSKENASPQDLAVIASSLLDVQERLQLLNVESPMNEDEIAENLEQELQQNIGAPAPQDSGVMPPL